MCEFMLDPFIHTANNAVYLDKSTFDMHKLENCQ